MHNPSCQDSLSYHLPLQLRWQINMCKGVSFERIIKPARVNISAPGLCKLITKAANPKIKYKDPAISTCGSTVMIILLDDLTVDVHVASSHECDEPRFAR
jgi:hypothetical protein